jgi:hypothetical protein
LGATTALNDPQSNSRERWHPHASRRTEARRGKFTSRYEGVALLAAVSLQARADHDCDLAARPWLARAPNDDEQQESKDEGDHGAVLDAISDCVTKIHKQVRAVGVCVMSIDVKHISS